MALGDNLNDISMLERVGYPVAMDNLAPEVKAVAKYITIQMKIVASVKQLKFLKDENQLS